MIRNRELDYLSLAWGRLLDINFEIN